MESLAKQIRENWVILSFIVALIMSWATFNTRLTSAEGDIATLSQVVTQINQININVAVIQQQLVDISKKLDKVAN